MIAKLRHRLHTHEEEMQAECKRKGLHCLHEQVNMNIAHKLKCRA